MGTTAHLVVRGTGREDVLMRAARRRIAELEARWSRFRPSSEVSQLNVARRGHPVCVSADTYRLVETAVDAWSLSAGAFDPTVLDAMLANGYDRSFDLLAGRACEVRPPRPAPGAGGIALDPTMCSVTLPEGLGIDPGGIGKGLAADIVAAELLDGGAVGALVDLGGDIRVVGEGPADGRWIIDIEDPCGGDRLLAHLALTDAGIATSSTRRRRWSTADGTRHHLLDPMTGRPLTGAAVAATAIAPTAWRAELATKAALVTERTDVRPDAHVVIVHADGRRLASAALEAVIA
jgi:FAD:protein FMN transferase